EAEITADRIKSDMVRNKRKPSDFAILFRTNFQSRAFEQELRRRNIPHHVAGGYKFFDRREVRDMICYMRYIANPKDEIALARIINRPRRGIGDTTIKRMNEISGEIGGMTAVLEKIREEPGVVTGMRSETVVALVDFLELIENFRKHFASAHKIAPVLRDLVHQLKFENEFRREGDNDDVVRARIGNLSELVNMAAYQEEKAEERITLFDFLADIAMQSRDDEDAAELGRVQLLTMHLAKGLEFPVVFLAGMEEGIFPSERSIQESREPEWALEEERRLFYVGITRAKEELVLTAAQTRRKFGASIDCVPSRFLEELPPHLVDTTSPAEDSKQNALTELSQGLRTLFQET
ncbi:MAG: exodeoxyribonuclease V subunit gamma, partial [Spirochaetia bacterium]|nr:exodeoxyribonuclease V subunit gamma [Spirochaetia bacterium]